MSEWISVKERLPESDEVLCVVYARDDYEFAWWYEGPEAWDSPDVGWIDGNEVEWWFPITPPPDNE